jgi:uncharacterized protein YggE
MGVKLGKLITVVEGESAPPQPRVALMAMRMKESSPIEAGESAVMVSVTARYAIKS